MLAERYQRYRNALVACGIPAVEADRLASESAATDAKLERGECPRCSEPIAKNRDVRQVGSTMEPGSWFQYRCPCGFAVDRVELEN